MSLEVIAKVQKLRRLAGSDNVNEAAAAAAAADKLIQAHGLAEAQLENDAGDGPREAASLDPTSLAEWRKTPAWLMRLSILLVQHYQCACYTEQYTRLNAIGYVKMARLRIVGRPSDVVSVRYMLGWLTVEIEGLAQRSARGKGRTYANSYRHGAVQGVIAAMREEREAMRTQAKANGQSAALALYDGHAAEAQAALAVAVPKLRKGRPVGGARDGSGYAAGERAGRGIHRGQAIGAASGTRALGSGS